MELSKTTIVCFFVGILIGMLTMNGIRDYEAAKDKPIKPDTSYSQVKLDSIMVKKGKHDSTIYKLNIKFKDDVEKSYLLNDSDAVNMFKQLSSDKSN